VGISVEDRFWSKVRIGDGCWEWTGAKAGRGYGVIGVGGSRRSGGRQDYAHRLSWEMANGPIPHGIFVCHRCDNPRCVRPGHLFLGSVQDNADDMVSKGRQSRGPRHADKTRGEAHGRAKLVEADVLAIRARRAAGETLMELAAAFGVNHGAISKIANRRTWRHLEDKARR
jgi:hypothetical protein